MFKLKYLPFILCSVSINAYAQDEFKPEQFIKELNKAIKSEHNGVSVKGFPLLIESTNRLWAETAIQRPQDFGIVVLDTNGEAIEVFGESTPFEQSGEDIVIPGYTIPDGAKYQLVGSSAWNGAVSQIAAKSAAKKPSNKSIIKAINVITDATDYIAQQLCAKKSRPTKLTLNLNAGFELVFNVSTGSEVEWDLEVICKRL